MKKTVRGGGIGVRRDEMGAAIRAPGATSACQTGTTPAGHWREIAEIQPVRRDRGSGTARAESPKARTWVRTRCIRGRVRRRQHFDRVAGQSRNSDSRRRIPRADLVAVRMRDHRLPAGDVIHSTPRSRRPCCADVSGLPGRDSA